jgi:hypothetical protein
MHRHDNPLERREKPFLELIGQLKKTRIPLAAVYALSTQLLVPTILETLKRVSWPLNAHHSLMISYNPTNLGFVKNSINDSDCFTTPDPVKNCKDGISLGLAKTFLE